MPAKVEGFKSKYRALVRAGFCGLGEWWLNSRYKRGALAIWRRIVGSGHFFFGASLRRTLLEVALLSLLLFWLGGNGAIIPDYRLLAITYLPGALAGILWASLRLRRRSGEFWLKKLSFFLASGLSLAALLVGTAFLLSLLRYRIEDLATTTLPDLLGGLDIAPTLGLYQFFIFLLTGPAQFETGTPLPLILGTRLAWYVVEAGLVFMVVRGLSLLAALPGGWLQRLAERRLLWRLTFSHFWVVVASLATAVISWAILLTLLNSVTATNTLSPQNFYELPAFQAQSMAQVIAKEQQANGALSPADLDAFLRYVNRDNPADATNNRLLQSQLPPRVKNMLPVQPVANITNAEVMLVTDRQGTLVATSNPARFPTGSNLLTVEPDEERREGWRQLLAKAAAGEQALNQLTLNRATPNILIAGAYPVLRQDGTVEQIILVVERPEVALLTALQGFIPFLALSAIFLVAALLTSIFSLLVALVFGFFQSRRLVRNLEQLELAADALAAGNLEQQAHVEAQDEIGRLAARFNLMATRLKESQLSLGREKQTAEQALQTKRELVANVSHELRTPVSTIRAHIEWLLMSLAEERADLSKAADPVMTRPKTINGELLEQYLDIIDRETERLGTLIEDLLDLSRVESQGLAVQLQPVQIAEVAENVKRTLGQLAQRERKVAVSLNLAPDLPLALADRTRLEQVVVNLTRNAINHTPAGGIISIGAAKVAPGEVALWVADTGVGIPPEDLDRIFERFYRRDASRSRYTGGAGLGLAIVKALVEAMGGTITVESILDEGSKFTVTLPVAGSGASKIQA